ncbi:MAG: GNAT family N-acetyltransferase [Bacteroidota bacterium]
MYIFSNPHITIAAVEDIPAIKDLLNSAYRGEAAKKTWTSEAHLISGDKRTDENDLQKVMRLPGSVFLKYTDAGQTISGCVNLQQHDHKIYLGMLSVSPGSQGTGIGKQLLQASEEYAKRLQCTTIYMSVISLRSELINWYQRHGYHATGETKPFIEDNLTGKHLQPLEFMMMEKILN